jgi:hypothetical protein
MSKIDVGVIFGDDNGYYWIIHQAQGHLSEVIKYAVEEVVGAYENEVSIVAVFPGADSLYMEKAYAQIIEMNKFAGEFLE